MFTDPKFARIGLSETEAKEQNIPYRLSKIPTASILRARTLSEPRGFLKALIDTKSDRILGFTVLAVGAGNKLSLEAADRRAHAPPERSAHAHIHALRLDILWAWRN